MSGLLWLAARALCATVFAIAVFGKARRPARFREFALSTQKLAMLPDRMATPVAGLVVLAEAATVALLALPAVPRAGFAMAGALLAVFAAVIVRAVRAGVLGECRCFGRASAMGGAAVLRNLLLLAVAAPAALVGPPAPGGAPGGTLGRALALLAGASAAVGFVYGYDRVARMALTRRPPAASRPEAG